MTTPTPFEKEFPMEAAILAHIYATQASQYFGARWLHIFSGGGWNNTPWGKYQ